MLDNYRLDSDLQLKLLSIEDGKALLDCVNRSRAQLSKFLYWVEDVKDLKGASDYLSARVNSKAPNAKWYQIRYQEKFSGVFGVKSINGAGVVEIGYWLSTCAQGQGNMRKIVDKLPHLLAGTESRVIEFRCLVQNKASISVAEKSGASLTKVVPEFLYMNGAMQDLLVYQVSIESFLTSNANHEH